MHAAVDDADRLFAAIVERRHVLESGSLTPDAQRCIDQRVHILNLRSMIDKGTPDGELPVKNCRRRSGHTGLLKFNDDLLIEPVWLLGAKPETNDVELGRRKEFEFRFRQTAPFQIFCQPAGFLNHASELADSERL